MAFALAVAGASVFVLYRFYCAQQTVKPPQQEELRYSRIPYADPKDFTLHPSMADTPLPVSGPKDRTGLYALERTYISTPSGATSVIYGANESGFSTGIVEPVSKRVVVDGTVAFDE